MKDYLKSACAVTLLQLSVISCEILDDDIEKHTSAEKPYVELSQVAEILAAVPLQQSHLDEVHKASMSSVRNGYDEEYTMIDLFESPGSGVGDQHHDISKASAQSGGYLRDLISDHVRQTPTKAGAAVQDPEMFLDALSASDIQIYWPFSENWDGKTLPVITFDPEDESDANVGYRLFHSDDGSRRVEEVVVDEAMAAQVPVWVVNRNSDAGYTTLEMLRREDPDWGEGGGTIIVKPDTKTSADRPLKTLVLKDFTMMRNYDSWFAGASEFFVLTITGGCSFA